MPYGAERENKDFVQSYCQSSIRYLNIPDLHDFLEAIIKKCFMAAKYWEKIYNSKTSLLHG